MGITKKGNAFAGKSVLQYELDIDSLKGNFVWVEGPYPAGAWPDIKIFLNTLSGQVNASRPTAATWGILTRSSAQTMTATQREILGCS